MPTSPAPRFARYRDIAADVAERLAGSRGADPMRGWTLEVLVASRGIAEAIGNELVARFPDGVAGVRIRTLETLARDLLNDANEYPRVANDAERRLSMRTAVRAFDHPMMEGRGLAAMLERSYRDVRDGGVTLAELRERVGRARGLRNPERTRLLLRVLTEYERLIDRLGAIDPSELLTRGAALASSASEQLVAGFYDMTDVQRRFVDSLRDAGKLVGEWIPAPESGGGATALLQFDTRDGELRGVAGEIRALLDDGVDAREIGIVARSLDPYDARLIERFAREHGFATTLAAETPLIAHRIGRGVASLLRIRDRGFPRAEVLELVRGGLKTRTRINADRVDAETRRARIAGGTSEELRAIRRRSPAVDDYIALVAELEELTSRVDLGRMTSLFRIDTDVDLQAASAIDEIADLFKRAQVFDVPSMLDALENTILVQRPAANSQRVWAGEIMRFRGRAFAHVFAVRMQDDRFPQRRNEDPLFPDHDRHLLGIREIGDGADEERLLFRVLHDAASTQLHFSYAGGDGFGKVLRPSRFVRHLPLTRPSATLSSQARREASMRALQLLAKSGTRSVFDGYLSPEILHDRIGIALQSVTPTQLEDFGECPQKFLLKHILGVTDIDDPERELQIHHRDKGTIDHRILERFYRGWTA
ncbi:MAG TPA: PD-(D/E)XK nuclease family protein, partial [Thermoanaerobaculia bacterium]|nr:PD-(D/E)XK nuclease family protein [Thermoanaerobaculia bacterium]